MTSATASPATGDIAKAPTLQALNAERIGSIGGFRSVAAPAVDQADQRLAGVVAPQILDHRIDRRLVPRPAGDMRGDHTCGWFQSGCPAGSGSGVVTSSMAAAIRPPSSAASSAS